MPAITEGPAGFTTITLLSKGAIGLETIKLVSVDQRVARWRFAEGSLAVEQLVEVFDNSNQQIRVAAVLQALAEMDEPIEGY